jgi:hypothetical protein
VPFADKSLRRNPSREEAEAAVRTLIRWAGDDPARLFASPALLQALLPFVGDE